MRPLTRRSLLVSGAALGALSTRPVRAFSAAPRPDLLLVCVADGGWDTSFTIDPKPNNPNVDGPAVNYPDSEELRTFHDGQLVACNDEIRPNVTRFFETWGDRTAIVRGLWTGSIVHEPCRVRVLTGSTVPSSPDFATIFGASRSDGKPIGAMDFSGLSYAGSLASSTARVGARSQLKALLDPSAVHPAPPDAGYQLPLFQTSGAERDAVRALLERRVEGFRALRGSDAVNGARLDAMLASLASAGRMIDDGPALVGGLVLGEPASFASQSAQAVELLDAGLCSAVTLAYDADWDTHTQNLEQHAFFDGFFAGIDAILVDLQARGLLERTLVVVVSEMGRTPKLNAGGGKDHWAHTSQLVIGAGVRGGRVYGATDEQMESMKIDLTTAEVLGPGWDESAPGERLKYDHFAAGVLQHLGVDSQPWLPATTPFLAWSDAV